MQFKPISGQTAFFKATSFDATASNCDPSASMVTTAVGLGGLPPDVK
jgi:hypothetical protein